MKFLLSLGLSLIFTVGAFACPKEMDSENGIVLTRTNTFFSTFFKPKDGGVTEQRIMIRGAKPEDISSFYPHPLAIGKRITKNTELSIEYEKSVTELNELDITKKWVSNFILKSGNNLLGSGKTTVSFISKNVISIGECKYDVWHVLDRFELKNKAPIIIEKFFAPNLNLVIGSIVISADGKTISSVAFDKIEVGKNY